VLSTYRGSLNPYMQEHMRNAFRMGWEAAEKGLDRRQAQTLAEAAKFNRVTGAGWWRGFDTQRGER
jgi:hypothetical protein